MRAKALGSMAVWTALSTLFKIGLGLLLIKLFTYHFGVEGLGEAANFMTFITFLGVFSGAGIFNGVTKYTAEYADNPSQTSILFSTSAQIILIFSTFLAIVFILFSAHLSEILFFNRERQGIVIAAAVAQFGIAWSNYFLAILKGKRNAKGYALSLIFGTLLGGLVFVIGLYAGGYQGALVGFVLMPALVFIPAYYFLGTQAVGIRSIFAKFDRLQALRLSRFSVMVCISALTLPLGYVLLRDLLMQHRDLSAVGLWQGGAKISDAYLQFITAIFSVYLLPTLAKLHHKQDIQREVWRVFRFAAVAVAVVSGIIYCLRDWIILILYSSAFLPMASLLKWQLLGDICKVLAYIFGYLIVAKGALKLYFAAEMFQFSMLLLLGIMLIPRFGEQGATLAYFGTYASYLMICIIGFRYYLKQETA